MELLDRYLQAVRFWLPKSQQQDLIAELSEDLQSQMEEREMELGRPLEKGEVSAILKKCGNPMVVAGRLGPQRHLIGPALFPIYLFVLKMVLLWILVPVFVFIVGPVNLANTGDWGRAIASTLGSLWSGAFLAAGVVTLVFAILERTQAIAGMTCTWDPSTLPPLQKSERKTSFVQTFCELAFNVFGFVWLLLVPNHLWMLLGPAATFLKPAPMWHAFYVPILLLALANILRPAIVLARPQWTWFPPASQVAQTMFSLILLHFILKGVVQIPNGEWYPFVTLADPVRDAAHSLRIVAVVNVSILISLACAWIGVSISGVVQTWQLLQFLRKQSSTARQPVSLQLL